MSKGFPERIFGLPAPGTAVTGTAKGSLLLGVTGERPTLYAKYFDIVGKAIKVDLEGSCSNIVTTPGTLQLSMQFGSIDVWLSGQIPLNVVAKTNLPWTLKGELFVSALGAGTAATIEGVLEFKSECLIGSPLPTVGGSGSLIVPVTAAAAGTGFDSTLAQIIDLSAQFSLTGNSIQLRRGSMDYWP